MRQRNYQTIWIIIVLECGIAIMIAISMNFHDKDTRDVINEIEVDSDDLHYP